MMVGTSNARKQRNAVVITIPAKFQIVAGQKFYIIKDEDTLRLIPQTEDFFERLGEEQGVDKLIQKYVP